jgi:hypothetical protein
MTFVQGGDVAAQRSEHQVEEREVRVGLVPQARSPSTTMPSAAANPSAAASLQASSERRPWAVKNHREECLDTTPDVGRSGTGRSGGRRG